LNPFEGHSLAHPFTGVVNGQKDTQFLTDSIYKAVNSYLH